MGREKECLANQPPCPTLSNCPVSSCLSSPMSRKKVSTPALTSTSMKYISTYIYVRTCHEINCEISYYTYQYIYSRHVIYCKICYMYIRTSPYYVPPYAECGITYGYFLSFVSKKVSIVLYTYVGAESPNSVFLPQYTKVYIHTYLSISLFLHVCMCTSLLLILHMIVLICFRCVSGLRNNYVCTISHLCTYTFPSPLLPH